MDLNGRKPIFRVQNSPRYDSIKPIKKISVFWENFPVLQVRILGRVCTHIYYFLEKNICFYAFWKAFRLSKCIKLKLSWSGLHLCCLQATESDPTVVLQLWMYSSTLAHGFLQVIEWTSNISNGQKDYLICWGLNPQLPAPQAARLSLAPVLLAYVLTEIY